VDLSGWVGVGLGETVIAGVIIIIIIIIFYFSPINLIRYRASQ